MTENRSFVVTTALRTGPEERDRAAALAKELGCPCVKRGRLSLNEVCHAAGAAGAVVVSRSRLALRYAGREFFFHPGLAKLRIREIMAGKTDQMVKAMDLRSGDRVLDCTLGLGADALVAAHVVGEYGWVTGLEAVPVVAALVRWGLEHYGAGRGPLAAAMRRVTVLTADHREYLPALPGNSFDVVYFDPMFRVPLQASSGMEPLRPLAEAAPLDTAAVAEAYRVARRRVVFKERRDSAEFRRLGFTRVEGGRYSPVAYGVLVKDGEPR